MEIFLSMRSDRFNQIKCDKQIKYMINCTYRILFVCVDALHPSQQFFSHVGDKFLSSSVEQVLSTGLSVLLTNTTQCLR